MARESAGQTLQATALVHEAWLRLGGDQQPRWENRAQFFAAAAEAMRRIIIDNTRRRKAARRGGTSEKVSASATGFDVPAPQLDDAELLLLNEALDNLAAHDARKAELVKQWYFVGLTLEEVAKVGSHREPRLGVCSRLAHERNRAAARMRPPPDSAIVVDINKWSRGEGAASPFMCGPEAFTRSRSWLRSEGALCPP